MSTKERVKMLIGLVNGCFDRFHPGHKHLLMQCSQQCEYLIVAVNSDASVKYLKGEGRPFDHLHKRMHNVNKYADACVPFDGFLGSLIVSIKPHILFVGYDHNTDTSVGNAQLAQGNRCAIVQISHLPGYSTTHEAESHAPSRP